MPIRLDSRAERFRPALCRLSCRQAGSRGGCGSVGSRHHRRCRGARRRGADRVHAQIRSCRSARRAALRVRAAEIDEARRACDARRSMRSAFARDRIEAYHRRQLPRDERFTDPLGVELGWRWTAIAAVGLYVPGGTAAYPSSVLMNAVPAKVAGVAAACHGGAGAGRQAQPARPCRRAHRRHRRNLSHRRRPGGRGARLWHGHHPRRWTRSSARATPMSRRPSAWYSARSAST